jgi:outer membrane protein assembly factor BamC
MTHRCLRVTVTALAALLALGLNGCGTTVLQSKKIDYKSQGKKTESLEVPPDLTAPTQDDRYAVPDSQGKGDATYSVYSKDREAAPEAANTAILPESNKVKIERAGTQRWLVVDANAENVWPTVKEFWNELGFIVNVERPEAGVMETDWAENRAKISEGGLRKWVGKVLDDAYSTPERDKFRTRVERSADKSKTEIYISHRGMYEIYTAEGQRETRWQPRPSDPNLEAEMLQRLMAKFGADEARAKADLNEKTENKARIARAANGASELTVVDGFERAWRRVGLALDRIGFTVEDRDRSKGLYFVRYIEPGTEKTEANKGLLSRLAFWRKDDDKGPSGAQYRIALAQAGDAATKVAVQDGAGAPEKSEAANKILALLFDQLK